MGNAWAYTAWIIYVVNVFIGCVNAFKMIAEFCICGHEHYTDSHCKDFYDVDENYYGFCKCQEFKLDNLRFIEDLAKAQGLI